MFVSRYQVNGSWNSGELARETRHHCMEVVSGLFFSHDALAHPWTPPRLFYIEVQ